MTGSDGDNAEPDVTGGGAFALRERPARIDDVDDIHALGVLVGAELDQPPVATRTEILADFEDPSLDPSTDTRVVHDAEGALLAYAVVYADRPGQTFVDIYLRPRLPVELLSHLLDQLLGFGIHRALDDAQRRGLTRTRVLTGAQRQDSGMFEAFARNGFTYARTWWRMQIDFVDTPLESPEPLASGYLVETVDPLRDQDADRVVALQQETFAEHYGFVPVSREVGVSELRSSAGFDPTMCRIVTRDGMDVAVLVGSDSHAEGGLGHVDSLGVIAAERGRGLGAHLLRETFAEYHRRGRRGVLLSVDSDNATGATHLYESVGMRPIETIDTWELPLGGLEAP